MTLSAFADMPLSIKMGDEYSDRIGVEELRIGSMDVPTDELGRIMINYRWKKKTFPHISVTDILSGNIQDDLFNDRIVLVGATAVGLHDMCVTPLQERYPGLEVHATIIDSILTGDFLYHPSWGSVFDILAIISTGLLLGLVLPRTGPMTGAIAGITFFSGPICKTCLW